jgi:tetratricopeptide (TPR) repeat protein
MTTPKAMKLEPPDTYHLRAAEGWLELGNTLEAGEEIARITPARLDHPDVLEMRWEICAVGRRWEPALEIAQRLVEIAPERSSGWLHRAYAMRRAPGGGLQKAWDALRPAFEKFSKVSLISFNLACYAAQLGRLDDAWEWLHKAMEAEGDVETIKGRALVDADLAALWDRIRAI